MDRNAFLLKNPEDADMGKPASKASTERNAKTPRRERNFRLVC
jgi:hypothetical protein